MRMVNILRVVLALLLGWASSAQATIIFTSDTSAELVGS
jgi:hypothetical protein